jgi:rRNA processing protein Krr1/Pno1
MGESMNEILNDIETLTIVRNAVSTGVEKEKTIELLDKVIRLKSLEITNFENEMEKEFARGIDRS